MGFTGVSQNLANWPSLASQIGKILRGVHPCRSEMDRCFLELSWQTKMIKQYEGKLISFAYPENWTLVDGGDEIPKEISLESPEGAVWMVNAFSSRVSAEDLWSEAEKTFKDNYEDFESSPIQTPFQPAPEMAFEADFYCLDFLVHACIYIFESGPLRMMVIHQAESRIFEKSADVMDAMTTSLIRDEVVSETDSE